MRKYHQLMLVLISSISVIVLFTYKSENSRLKDVLNAVNFFSRKDVEELRLITNLTAIENDQIDFNRPLPVWQLIGNAFHAYASYWHRNELISSGGEVITLVSGKRGAVVNFRCSAYYSDGRLAHGTFRFQHLNQQDQKNDSGAVYTNYIFYCRLKSVFGEPRNVLYTDLSGRNIAEHKLRLRLITNSKYETYAKQIQLSACLDLMSFNMSSDFAQKDSRVLEFFLHHYVLGIKQFIVYNGEELSDKFLHKLRKLTNLRIHSLPFNFPFESKNDTTRLRDLIKADCLLRCMHKSKFTILLELNEFFFPNAKLNNEQSVMYSLNSYGTNSNTFALQTYSVCMDSKNELLTNNNFYDPEAITPYNIHIYKPLVLTSASSPSLISSSTTTYLPPSSAFVHRYIDCLNVGRDGVHPWQSGVRENFMKNINDIKLEVKQLMYT